VLIRGHGGDTVVFPALSRILLRGRPSTDQGQFGRLDEGFGGARGTSDGHFAICI
jgi:hypothetical protein